MTHPTESQAVPTNQYHSKDIILCIFWMVQLLHLTSWRVIAPPWRARVYTTSGSAPPADPSSQSSPAQCSTGAEPGKIETAWRLICNWKKSITCWDIDLSSYLNVCLYEENKQYKTNIRLQFGRPGFDQFCLELWSGDRLWQWMSSKPKSNSCLIWDTVATQDATLRGTQGRC